MSLEKPDLPDEKIIASLRENYGFPVEEIHFLPIGNDAAAWVYQVRADKDYFLKVKKGEIDTPALLIPHALQDAGIGQVVAPLAAHSGGLSVALEGFSLILYPFIVGRKGLSLPQWQELGSILSKIHHTKLPSGLAVQVKQEDFISPWIDLVQHLHENIDHHEFQSPAARQLVKFWQSKSETILKIVERTEALGQKLKAKPPEFQLCHADIHTANILIDGLDQLHIIDWDGVLFAPKERDLIFIVGNNMSAQSETQTAFFEGYGQTQVDPLALAYYHYEWAAQEIGDYGERAFLMSDVGEPTRRDALHGFERLFMPGKDVDTALQCRIP